MFNVKMVVDSVLVKNLTLCKKKHYIKKKKIPCLYIYIYIYIMVVSHYI